MGHFYEITGETAVDIKAHLEARRTRWAMALKELAADLGLKPKDIELITQDWRACPLTGFSLNVEATPDPEKFVELKLSRSRRGSGLLGVTIYTFARNKTGKALQKKYGKIYAGYKTVEQILEPLKLPHFFTGDQGIGTYTPGCGVYQDRVLVLVPKEIKIKHKDAARISDVEAEAIQAPAKQKKTRRKVSTAKA